MAKATIIVHYAICLLFTMPDVAINDDPPPTPPVPPDDNACCGSGCDPCVFDFYTEDLQRYRAELQAWEERQKKKAAGPSQ